MTTLDFGPNADAYSTQVSDHSSIPQESRISILDVTSNETINRSHDHDKPPPSPGYLPSLQENHRDSLTLFQLARWFYPRLNSSHRRLVLWVFVQLLVGFTALCTSLFVKSLALSGFGYIVIFDALGLFSVLASEVLSTYQAASEPSNAYPFGLKRLEVVLGFVNILYVLFAATNIIKEGVECLLLGESHELAEPVPSSEGFGFLPGFLVIICCFVTLFTAVTYRNHWKLSILRFRKSAVSFNSYPSQSSPLNAFVLSTLVCGILTATLLFNYNFGLGPELMDSIVALYQAASIIYLTGPLALNYALVLLQTLPAVPSAHFSQAVMEVSSLPYVDRCENVHSWQTTFGEHVGSLDVILKNDSGSMLDYQSILNSVHTPWKRAFYHCTVQVIEE